MKEYIINNTITTITAGIMLLSGIFALSFFVAFAAEDQVIVNQQVNTTDSTAPTQPQNLTATAVSTSGIDLAWDSSNDNVGVTGYNVYRGLTQIATTSNTTYSDTGLTANTTYSYTVSAFDAANNESARSATSSATTNAEAQEEDEDGGGPGGGGPPSDVPPLKIVDFKVSTDIESAVLAWKTNLPAAATVSWGESQDYEIGSLAEPSMSRGHETTLTNLTANTQYYYKVEVQDETRRKAGVTGSFRTPAFADTEAPSNVSGFQAILNNGGVDLSWDNPIEDDFEEVRLVRSDKFIPQDPFDGLVIHEGDDEKARDTNIEEGTVYYYAIFTKDRDGNYSSGAVARVVVPAADGTVPVEGDPFDEFPEAPETEVPEVITDLSIDDFIFIQEGEQLETKASGVVEVDGTKRLIVRLPYEKAPEVLKTIGLTIRDADDPEKQFTFLLHVDEEKNHYSAAIAPLGKGGVYEFNVAVLDYKNQRLKKMEGALVASVHTFMQTGNGDSLTAAGAIIGLLILLALGLVARQVYLYAKARIRRKPEVVPAGKYG